MTLKAVCWSAFLGKNDQVTVGDLLYFKILAPYPLQRYFSAMFLCLVLRIVLSTGVAVKEVKNMYL